MKAVKRIVVLGATAGLIMAGAGAATANDGQHHGKSQKKYSKHHKSYKSKKGHKHGAKHVNKNRGAQALTLGNKGFVAGNVVQGDLIGLDQVNVCGNSGGIVALQNGAIANECLNELDD